MASALEQFVNTVRNLSQGKSDRILYCLQININLRLYLFFHFQEISESCATI